MGVGVRNKIRRFGYIYTSRDWTSEEKGGNIYALVENHVGEEDNAEQIFGLLLIMGLDDGNGARISTWNRVWPKLEAIPIFLMVAYATAPSTDADHPTYSGAVVRINAYRVHMSQSNTGNNLEFTATGFNPTPTDVVIVRRILQGLRLSNSETLPPELALAVLSLAEYCPRLECHRRELMCYNANTFWAPGPTADVAGIYLTSPPIPTPNERLGESIVRAKRITFQLRSADQGWADFGGEGTYNNSHTWFEAGILFPLNASEAAGSLEDDALKQTFKTPKDARETFAEHGWGFVQYQGRDSWRVHNNITAQAEFRDYRVDWIAGVSTDVIDPLAMGNGEGFLESLEPGCVVALWARAEQQAWENRVKEATIEILYDTV